MRLSDTYDGSRAPFEGDRTLLLRTLPAGARVERASATLTPVDATGGANPFAETITFDRASGGWGATKTAVAGRWVEVDFHGRRTLAGVAGVGLAKTTLQADLGGAFVEVNENGGMRAAADLPFELRSDVDPLPSLTVVKFKLTNPREVTASPDVSEVLIRSVPTNVSLRLGDMPAFWTRPGEMSRPETTPDFSAVLRALLAEARVENGFYLVPLVLHSDAVARLTVELEIEYLIEQSPLSAGLGEVVVPFDLSGRPSAGRDVPLLAVPPGARVAEGGVSGRVTGVFEDTRLVRETIGAARPLGFVEVSPALSLAQPVSLAAETVVTDVDLLIAVGRTTRLQLDLREDFDGKPAPSSLMPVPVEFELLGPAGHDDAALRAGGAPPAMREPKWISATLPTPFKFQSGVAYWLVLQSVEGEVRWEVAPAAATDALPGAQYTDDGGLSWRDAGVVVESEDEAARATGVRPRAFFRLRRRPARFEMPVEFAVGEGAAAVPVDLSGFEALGRVDFALEASDLARAVNEYLDTAAAPGCPADEHVYNGDFEQWLGVGETLSETTNTELESPPLSVGVSPDGTWAYVGLTRSEKGVLRIVDVARDTMLDAEVLLELSPRKLLISPDGVRAYALDERRIQIIDAGRHRAAAPPFDPLAQDGNSTFTEIEAAALSADGARLYLVVGPGDADGPPASSRRECRVIETAALESAATSAGRPSQELQFVAAPLDTGARVTALAVSPDESLIFLCAAGREGDGKLFVLDAATLRPASPAQQSVAVGLAPSAIVPTPDGRRCLVVNSGEDSVTLVEIETKNRVVSLTTQRLAGVGDGPVGAVVSADGRRAYVVSRVGRLLTQIDLARRVIAREFQLGSPPQAIALTPDAGRVYVASGGLGDESPPSPAANSLISIQVGARLPVAWDLTSGGVTPLRLPGPLRQVALLGAGPSATPTALSQLVPVTQNCAYDFSFLAVASEPDAVAEVFWLGGGCGLLRADFVLIEALPPSSDVAVGADLARAARAGVAPAPLVLHHSRLVAPAGATQAEIRFTVPAHVSAAVESVSLKGTAEAVENADLSRRQQGRPVGWQLSPEGAAGFSLLTNEGGTLLRNAGASAVELIQIVSASAGQPFTLEFRGHAEAGPRATANPSLALHWLSEDGAVTGDPAVLELSPAGFGTSTATGLAPPDATQAEVRLSVPAGTSERVERVSLRFAPTTLVPLSFFAHAPGELTLLDWRVAFDEAKAAPPGVPEGGLCAPTPPGRQPGSASPDGGDGDDTQFCPCCEGQQPARDIGPLETGSGRAATLRRCGGCGDEVVRFGGAQSAPTGAAPRRESVRRPVIHLAGMRTELLRPAGSQDATLAAVAREPVERAAPHPLTAVRGIGEVRTKELTAVGISSVEALAVAAPAQVARAKSVPPKLAADFIAQARELLKS